MIIRDGRCYAEKPGRLLKITAVEETSPYQLRVVFNDSEVRLFDGRCLLNAEVFAPLADARVFSQYKLDYETLTWFDGEIDVAPEFVYNHSKELIPQTSPTA